MDTIARFWLLLPGVLAGGRGEVGRDSLPVTVFHVGGLPSAIEGEGLEMALREVLSEQFRSSPSGRIEVFPLSTGAGTPDLLLRRLMSGTFLSFFSVERLLVLGVLHGCVGEVDDFDVGPGGESDGWRLGRRSLKALSLALESMGSFGLTLMEMLSVLFLVLYLWWDVLDNVGRG